MAGLVYGNDAAARGAPLLFVLSDQDDHRFMKDDDDNDDRCMRAVAAGDGAAFRELFDRWKLPVLNYCYRVCGSYADAEDILMKAFEDIWRMAARYEGRGTFSAWLFSIVRGKLLHHWRGRARRLPESLSAGLVSAEGGMGEIASGDDPARRVEQEDALLQSLAALPDAQREALLLSIHSRLAGAEIASLLGISLQNFHVLVHRARQTLTRQLEDLLA